MKLRHSPWERIASRRKTVELRLYDEKRQTIGIGDTIVFTDTQTGARLRARVLALHRFSDFSALYAALPLAACGYSEEEIPTASYRDMEAYYTPAEQEKYGVVGIEIEVL